jgi:hypothetical protein
VLVTFAGHGCREDNYEGRSKRAMIEVGSQVIYRKTKYSRKPGPRAAAINPSKHGDSYSYFVDKYWVVVECSSPDKIVVLTRRGKRLTLNADDPNLRPAGLLNRLLHRKRFPSFNAS